MKSSKGFLAGLFLLLAGVSLGGPPPYYNADPAVKGNFDDIFNRHATHVHDGISSPMFQRLGIGFGSVNAANFDSVLDIYYYGPGLSRPGIDVGVENTGYSRVPVFVATNYDTPVDYGGLSMAFINQKDDGSDYQIGAFAFSQYGADASRSRFELFLRAGASEATSDSVPIIQAIGLTAPGYAHLLIGPTTYTPGSTLHVESNSGDVDSGIRIERRNSSTGRWNIFVDSDGDLRLREVDTTAGGIEIRKSAGVSDPGQVNVAGNLSASGRLIGKGVTDGTAAAQGDIGEHISTRTAVFANMATSGQFGNVVSTTLSPGDWNVSGSIVATINGATINVQYMAISLFSANTLTDHTTGYNVLPARPAVSGADVGQTVADFNVNVSTTTTIYLKAYATYSVATPQVLGSMTAIRKR